MRIESAIAARGVGYFTPLDATITGPTMLEGGETGNWTANVSDGTAPYSYTWYYRLKGNINWHQVGTGSTYSRSSGGNDFELKVEVTDANSKGGYDLHTVLVDEVDIPDPCPPLCM